MKPQARNLITGDGLLAYRWAYDLSGRIEYIGAAVPGQSETDPVWQIMRYSYDGDGNVVTRKFAGGVADFRWQWSERDSYAYS